MTSTNAKRDLNIKPNPFRPKETPLKRKESHYGTLVVARHEKQRNRYMDDLALQVSDAAMATSDYTHPGESLTKFIRKIKAQVFAEMQSAPPQELNKEYGLPKK